MYVGFQNPFHGQIVRLDVLNNLVGRAHISAASGIIEIQHRIQNRTGLAVGIAHDITEGVSGFVEKMLNDGLGHGIHL